MDGRVGALYPAPAPEWVEVFTYEDWLMLLYSSLGQGLSMPLRLLWKPQVIKAYDKIKKNKLRKKIIISELVDYWVIVDFHYMFHYYQLHLDR